MKVERRNAARRGRRGCGFASLAFALCLAGAQARPSDVCITALRRALDGRAAWTMERTLGKGGRTLVSSGTVECVAKSGIVWRVTAPFESSVAMTTNAMVFADEEGMRVKPLSELPHYAEIRAKTDAFAAGETRAFEGIFDLSASDLPQDGWKLVMKPEISAMERLFTEIELTGAALPTNAVLKTADGGRCVIRFRENADAL